MIRPIQNLTTYETIPRNITPLYEWRMTSRFKYNQGELLTVPPRERGNRFAEGLDNYVRQAEQVVQERMLNLSKEHTTYRFMQNSNPPIPSGGFVNLLAQ